MIPARSGQPLTLRLAEPARAGVRLHGFDGLKGLAMLLVLLYHFGEVFGAQGNTLHGEVGVDIFLIVSGILLGINSYALPAGAFLRRRFLRIYPSYWFALALFLALNLAFFGDRRTAPDIILHILGLHAFGLPAYFSAVNDSFWFISLIVLLYGLFLLIRPWLGDLGLTVAVGALLTIALCDYYEATQSGGGMGHLAGRIPSVFLGLILGQLASGRPLQIRLGPCTVLAAVFLLHLALYRGFVFVYPTMALAWIAGYFTVDRWLRRRHGGRVLLSCLSFLGVYSYEIYLLHQPIMRDYSRQLLFRCWGIDAPSPLQLQAAVIAAFGAVLAAAVLLHRASNAFFRPGPARA